MLMTPLLAFKICRRCSSVTIIYLAHECTEAYTIFKQVWADNDIATSSWILIN